MLNIVTVGENRKKRGGTVTMIKTISLLVSLIVTIDWSVWIPLCDSTEF